MINPQIVLIAIAGTYSTVKLYKVNRRLRREKAAIAAALQLSLQLTMYYATLLDRNEVEISDFDRIVLNSFLETSKEKS